jgi:TetR/AcrR family transcriptional regulator
MTAKNRSARRTRDADATRAALLSAATEVFADVGYAGARVDEIAERARVNKRMIYEYFGDKHGLYREVLTSRLALPAFSSHEAGDPREAVAELIRWYFGLLAGDQAFARLLAWGMLAGSRSRKKHALLLSSVAPVEEQFSNVLRRGITSGAFRSDIDHEMLRTTILSLCLGYFLQHDVMTAALRNEGGRWTDDEFLENGICRVLFDGIAATEVSP